MGKLSKVNFNDYKPLRDVIFEALREAIITGELKPGERLMEVNLSVKLGVSRTPVREAIRKLELEGLITNSPRKGAYVANLSIKNIMDVLEVRSGLDSLAAELAAARISESETDELQQVQAQCMSFADNGNLQGLIKKDIEFHDIIYKASRNEKLIQIANNLREQVLRFRIIYLKDYGSPREIMKEHEEILVSILAKDGIKAQKAAKLHIKRQESAIVNAIKK